MQGIDLFRQNKELYLNPDERPTSGPPRVAPFKLHTINENDELISERSYRIEQVA